MTVIQHPTATPNGVRHVPAPSLTFNAEDTAVLLLDGMFRRLAHAAGASWDDANTDEVRLVVQSIGDAAR